MSLSIIDSNLKCQKCISFLVQSSYKLWPSRIIIFAFYSVCCNFEPINKFDLCGLNNWNFDTELKITIIHRMISSDIIGRRFIRYFHYLKELKKHIYCLYSPTCPPACPEPSVQTNCTNSFRGSWWW